PSPQPSPAGRGSASSSAAGRGGALASAAGRGSAFASVCTSRARSFRGEPTGVRPLPAGGGWGEGAPPASVPRLHFAPSPTAAPPDKPTWEHSFQWRARSEASRLGFALSQRERVGVRENLPPPSLAFTLSRALQRKLVINEHGSIHS